MDYCSSCRRHLNGALVCPGCGAYAPDIDPAAYARVTPAPATMATAGAVAGTDPGDFDTWQDGGPGDETDVLAAPPVTEGRAARRRQRARWKKNQRRAVVATAVALVGGGLTMVATDQQSGDRVRAAAAPHDPGVDLGEVPTGQGSNSTVTRPEEPRSTPTPSAAERSSRQGDTGRARTAPSDDGGVREVAAQPRTTATSTPPPSVKAPSVSDDTGSAGTGGTGVTDGTGDIADRPEATPAPTPPSANDGAGSPDSGAQEPTTPPATKSPQELCLLVLCVGVD